MKEIADFIERNFKEIDKRDTARATYISWTYKEKDYCVSYGEKSSGLYIFSCGDDMWSFKLAQTEYQMISIIRKELNYYEKCDC